MAFVVEAVADNNSLSKSGNNKISITENYTVHCIDNTERIKTNN
jgi:hypothetical protein